MVLILCRILLDSTVLYCTVLYCTYSILPYSIILYCVVLCYTVQYGTMQVLYCTVPSTQRIRVVTFGNPKGAEAVAAWSTLPFLLSSFIAA